MQTKILLTIVICSIVTNVNAQINKGAVLLGGEVGFATGNSQNANFTGTNTGFNFSPALGKAIKENLVIGADITFSYVKNDQAAYNSEKTNAYGAGFFIRRYKELAKGFYLFGQARAGVNYSKQDYTDLTQQNSGYISKTTNAQLAIYPGLAYAVSKKLQLEASFNNLAYIQFSHGQTTYNNTQLSPTKMNEFSLGSSLSNFSGLTVGFRILLN